MHLPLTLLHDMGGLPGLELQAVMSVLAQFFLATLVSGLFWWPYQYLVRPIYLCRCVLFCLRFWVW